ncbi:subtilisin-like protein [Lactarius psammicola]|nr:subtilisin-like protein [Lactarius psammicola]
MHVKHTWNVVPTNWESLGQPPPDATINLYIALNPHQEGALIDALYQVSDHGHPRHVLLTTPPPAPLFMSPSWSSRAQIPRRHSFGAAATWAEAEAALGKPARVLSSRAGEIYVRTLRSLYKTSAYVPAATDQNKLRYASAMVYPTPVIFYSTGGGGKLSTPGGQRLPRDAYLEWVHHLFDQPKLPQIINLPYGVPETNVLQQYAIALCNLFAALGGYNVSVLFSTGDDGVGVGDCKDTSGNVRFTPEFPAIYRRGFAGPYVTSVGGTTGNPEAAAVISRGGFSNHFPCPPYQNRAVSEYLDRIGSKHAGRYNREGRGTPDIAAQALKLITFVNKTMPALLWMAQAVCKPPLGFLNPRLYDDGRTGLNDITSGSNPGPGTDGFPAVVGWDPVTGLGTPNFVEQQNIFVPPAGGPPQGNQTNVLGAANQQQY